MDYADAVAYSVHDLDDFYRAGLVPLEQLRHEFDRELDRFKNGGKVDPAAVDRQTKALEQLMDVLPVERRYAATYEERVQLRTATSWLINHFVSGLEVKKGTDDLTLVVPEDREIPMRFLQSLVWNHVIENPRLRTQQHGQQEIIRKLFDIYLAAIRRFDLGRTSPDAALIPPAFRSELARLDTVGTGDRNEMEVRLAVDIVASLTDNQATLLYRRLTGMASGSITDLLWS